MLHVQTTSKVVSSSSVKTILTEPKNKPTKVAKKNA
jgi:hypothetical protein